MAWQVLKRFAAANVASLAVVAFLANPAGAATNPGSALGPSGTSEAVIYTIPVTNKAKSPIYAYDATTGRQIETLQGVGGIFLSTLLVEPSGVVDVATNTNSNPYTGEIFKYKPGATKPYEILSTAYSLITTAISKTGETAAIEQNNFSEYIEFYEPDRKHASRMLASNWDAIFHATYSPDGTLWLDGYDTSLNYVFGYVSKGGSTIVPVPFESAPFPGALLADPSGNIVVEEAGQLLAFTPAGRRAYVVRLAFEALYESAALSADGTTLYTCSGGQQNFVYRFPAGGRPIRTFGVYSSLIATGAIPR